MSGATVRRRVVVRGRVQGVFFRDSCQREAIGHGVTGWVRNTGDGDVEAVFEGAAEAVERMVDWCRVGPRMARVDKVEVHDEAVAGETRFRVR